MQDIRVNGRLQRVFVLKQTEDRVVYIPVKTLHRVDYDRLNKMEASKPNNLPLLDFMSKQKLDNGRLALVQFDKLIQVATLKDDGDAVRLTKPDEKMIHAQLGGLEKKNTEQPQVQIVRVEVPVYVPQPAVDGTLNSVAQPAPVAAPVIDNRPVYQFTNKKGEQQTWTKQGRMPNALQELVDAGEDIEKYRIK
jgi:hypothetical protein